MCFDLPGVSGLYMISFYYLSHHLFCFSVQYALLHSHFLYAAFIYKNQGLIRDFFNILNGLEVWCILFYQYFSRFWIMCTSSAYDQQVILRLIYILEIFFNNYLIPYLIKVTPFYLHGSKIWQFGKCYVVHLNYIDIAFVMGVIWILVNTAS